MNVTHFICPGCGAEVRAGPQGCPKCNKAARRRGPAEPKPWEQDELYDGLDLDFSDDDEFDYDRFIAEEFGGPPKRSRREWLWWATALVLLVALIYYFVL